MADSTKIEWADATWNPITGCTLVDEGCRNCYAAELAASRLRNHPSRQGLAKRNAKGVASFTGEVRLNEDWLDQPLRWRKPRMVFVCAHGDLFHESVPDEWIDRVFAVMALAPQHIFQVLTKRPERAREYLHSLIGDEDRCRAVIEASRKSGALIDDLPYLRDRLVNLPLPNVWIGTSVSDQASADARIPHLLDTPAAVRFVSAEPLLESIHFGHYQGGYQSEATNWEGRRLDWIIVGGESGKNARPMHPEWARSIRDQCRAAGTAFFFKQWGAWLPSSHAAHLGDEVDGCALGEWHDSGKDWIEACMCRDGDPDMPMFLSANAPPVGCWTGRNGTRFRDDPDPARHHARPLRRGHPPRSGC